MRRNEAARALLFGALALFALAWFETATAHGAFPGENGRIAFQSNATGVQEIYVMNPDGSGQTRLTCGASTPADIGRSPASAPAWSSSGSQIAFQRTQLAALRFEAVFKMNADGSGHGHVGAGGSPAWSPDQERIAFDTRPTDPIIGVMSVDGGDRAEFPSVAGQAPAWSPAGERIAFSARSEQGGIDAINPDGTGQTRIGRSGHSPSWSPDGERIAFLTLGAVWRMNADGSSRARLARAATSAGSPAWSPDGERIAFVRNGDIWSMNADGSEQTNLTNSPTQESDPDWQPLSTSRLGPPPSQFCFEALRRNTRRGIARLVVEVPRPGRVVLQRRPGVRRFAQAHRGEGKGRVVLRVRPRGKARQRLNRQARRTGRARVRVRAQVTYRPWVGEPRTKGRRVWLVQR